jgi:hypothetical protein
MMLECIRSRTVHTVGVRKRMADGATEEEALAALYARTSTRSDSAQAQFRASAKESLGVLV